MNKIALQVLAVLTFLCAGGLDAAVIQTRDGTSLQGTIRLDGDGLIVQAPNGAESRVEWSAVQRAVFTPTSNPPSPAQTAPAQTASDQPKPTDRPSRPQGLLAEYFAGYNLQDLRLIRIDPRIDNWWSEHGSPDPAVPENFSARWTGQIEAAHSETYTFRVGFDSGGRFWLDNRLLVDHWNGPGTFSTKLDLKAGQRYDVKLEFRKGRWGGNARLIWRSKHQPEEAIPSKYLYPPPGIHPPTVAIRSPQNDSVLLSPANIFLEADAADTDGAVRKVEFFVDDRSIGTVEQSPWRLEWKNASPGHHKLTARATDDSAITTLSQPAHIVVGDKADGSLPDPWMALSVGDLQPLGSASYADNTFTLRGTDGDLWGEQDRLYHLCQQLRGDGTLVARIKRFEAVHGSGAAAGLLIREHLARDKARQVFLGFVFDGGIAIVHRDNIWQQPKRWEDAGQPPGWLKLSRYGKTIKAYQSHDGRNWQLLGERHIDLPTNVFIGLAIANPVSEIGAADFDHVSLTAGPPPLESTIKGILLTNGSILAGQVRSVDDTSVKLRHANREIIIPTSQVARILFRPLTSEAIQRVLPGRSGVILNNGDFVDGAVSFKDGQVRVSSVLFGMRRFNTWDQTTAAVLRQVQPVDCPYQISTIDGSLFKAKTITIDAGKIRVLDSSDIAFTLHLGEIAEVRAID